MVEVDRDIYVLYSLWNNWKLEPVPYVDIFEKCEDKLSKTEILRALHTLESWSCVNRTYAKKGDRIYTAYQIDDKYGTAYRLESKPLNLEETSIIRSKNNG